MQKNIFDFYSHEEGFVFDGSVAMEVRPRLFLGGRIKEKRVFLAYRF